MTTTTMPMTPQTSPFRSRKLQGIALAVLASAGAIWAASSFTREPPPPPPRAIGIEVGDDNVTLAADAPQ